MITKTKELQGKDYLNSAKWYKKSEEHKYSRDVYSTYTYRECMLEYIYQYNITVYNCSSLALLLILFSYISLWFVLIYWLSEYKSHYQIPDLAIAHMNVVWIAILNAYYDFDEICTSGIQNIPCFV